MATWSRDQSQGANRAPIKSSGVTSRAMGNLQSSSAKQKAHARRSNGIKMRWSVDVTKTSDKPKDREFLLPRREDYKPPRLRGASGSRLAPAKRAMVELRTQNRKAFFAELGVTV